jgi:hypothetical protein
MLRWDGSPSIAFQRRNAEVFAEGFTVSPQFPIIQHVIVPPAQTEVSWRILTPLRTEPVHKRPT